MKAPSNIRVRQTRCDRKLEWFYICDYIVHSSCYVFNDEKKEVDIACNIGIFMPV